MAVADLIKAFSLPESRSSSSTTAQVFGFLSVLAISGSVALLTLAAGKLKLINADASEKTDGRDRSTQEGRASVAKTDGGDGANSRAMDGRDRVVRRKRVRFAETVVEPRGNSRDYRVRFPHNGSRDEPLFNKKKDNSSMPANRMALYKGLLQYRLQHSASFHS